jgi:hypothetical protein
MKKWMMALTLIAISSQSFALQVSNTVPVDTYKKCSLEKPFDISFDGGATVSDDQGKEVIIIIIIIIIFDDQGKEREINIDRLTVRERLQLRLSNCN